LQDQYEVFNSPYASDPTHSLVRQSSSDRADSSSSARTTSCVFASASALTAQDLILNESSGQLARIIVRHTVELVVRAWDNSSINPDEVVRATAR